MAAPGWLRHIRPATTASVRRKADKAKSTSTVSFQMHFVSRTTNSTFLQLGRPGAWNVRSPRPTRTLGLLGNRGPLHMVPAPLAAPPRHLGQVTPSFCPRLSYSVTSIAAPEQRPQLKSFALLLQRWKSRVLFFSVFLCKNASCLFQRLDKWTSPFQTKLLIHRPGGDKLRVCCEP